MSDYPTGQEELDIGTVCWAMPSEIAVTFRSPRDSFVTVNGVAYEFVVYFLLTDKGWRVQNQNLMMTRVHDPKPWTWPARTQLLRVLGELLATLSTPEQLRNAAIARVRGEITSVEDEVAELTDKISDLMAERGRLVSQLQVLLTEVESASA